MHQTIAMHDAIGNDIAHMYDILNRKHDVFVYCDYLENTSLNRTSKDILFETIADRKNLLIYHHSTYWEEGENILAKTKAKIIFRYHNITPASYFQSYDQEYFTKCSKGREQTLRLYRRYSNALWMGCSKYNFVDVGINGSSRIIVIPPFNNIERWTKTTPDEGVLQSLLENHTINLLFVGRIVPNKAHRFLLQIIADYLSYYDTEIILHVAGKKDNNLLKYTCELEDYARSCIPDKNIIWLGRIEDPIMLAYYLGCDFYLNCSEHEGFCVPIIEAQSLYLPIIAKRSSAIPETLGEQQLILDDDPRKYSAAIHILSKNDNYRDFLIQNGYKNYWHRFRNSIIEGLFLETINEYAGISE